jgi:hypothetical protein
MELVIVLLVLYGAQCLALLPYGGVLFVRPLGRWFVSHGPGWRLLHPIPSASTLIASRFPLVEAGHRLQSRGVATWISRLDWRARKPQLELSAVERVEARGAIVRVNGHAFARGVCKVHAESLARLLRDLAEMPPDAVRARIEAEFGESLSLDRYTEESERVKHATRWLVWMADIYFGWIFVALPILTWRLGAEGALTLVLPVLLLLHLATLLSFARAHRELLPRKDGALVEAVIAALFYPPLLLRGLHELRTAALARFHPAAVAAAVLRKDEQRSFLRAELLRSANRAEGGPREGGLALAELERRALLRLANELGESEDALFDPPPRHDPLAPSYCPACLTEYRREQGQCSDCDVDLIRYPL